MKKIVSLLLAVLFCLGLLSLVGCGKINDEKVAVLWSGEATTMDPNSLLNAMDRAMYIERISCEYYGAKGDADEQLNQAKAALDAGCAALVVEAVSAKIVPAIIECAKDKNVPVIFMGSYVSLTSIDLSEAYDKCVIVGSDTNTLTDVKGKMIADYIKENYKKIDKYQDNKITYYASDYYNPAGTYQFAVDKANELLATEDYAVKGENKQKINLSLEPGDMTNFDVLNVDLTEYEMILTIDDQEALKALVKLQEKGYNTDKLTTHFVPIFTLGDTADYKAYVVEQGKDKYEQNKYLVDLTNVSEQDLEAMVYTTRNVIGAGRIAGTIVRDNDAMACAVAKIVSNMIQGKDTFNGVASKPKKDQPASVIVEGTKVRIRFIALTE